MLRSGFQQRFCCPSLLLRTRTATSRWPRPFLEALPPSCCALRHALSLTLPGAIARSLCCEGFAEAWLRLRQPKLALAHPGGAVTWCFLQLLTRFGFSLVPAPSVDPNDQKKTACYDIDVEVDDTLKTQMNSFLLSTASQQEIAALDNKVGEGSCGAAPLLLRGGDVSGAGQPLPGQELALLGAEGG